MKSPAPTCLPLLLSLVALVILSLVTALPVAAQQPPTIHAVRAGETLTAIAARYGTTPQAIMQSNGLSGSLIYPGQRLSIPSGTTSGSSADFGATSQISGCNNDQVYVVRPGDSLAAIAAQWGVTVPVLKQANGLVSDSLWVGQSLKWVCAANLAGSSRMLPTVPGDKNVTARCGSHVVIQAGDTLSQVAARCGVSVTALKATNGLVSNMVLVGQSLRIPGGDSSSRVR